MAGTTQLKCEICGEEMLAKIDKKNNRVIIFCPTMLKDHDIYVVMIPQWIKTDKMKGERLQLMKKRPKTYKRREIRGMEK